MKEKILVIEDDHLILANILELLELEDLQAIGAENGLIGLDLAKKEMPSLIISDINMPGMDGIEVLQALRQDPETAKIPFIIMTGDTTNMERLQSLELKADGYLLKPVTLDKFIEAIETHLGKRG